MKHTKVLSVVVSLIALVVIFQPQVSVKDTCIIWLAVILASFIVDYVDNITRRLQNEGNL